MVWCWMWFRYLRILCKGKDRNWISGKENSINENDQRKLSKVIIIYINLSKFLIGIWEMKYSRILGCFWIMRAWNIEF